MINNRVRSYYAITDAGRQYLVQARQEYREMHAAFTAIMGDE